MTKTSEFKVNRKPLALTIAGFDPSGGAGILADCRTFNALGCRAAAVITSITYQNPREVFGAVHQGPGGVRDQLHPLLVELPAGLKTGMLPTSEVVVEVARQIRENLLPSPVVDPVMVSSTGQRLVDDDALRVTISDLFPLARLVTPNIPEAERITGLVIKTESSMLEAAAAMRLMGAQAVLIKGGHLAPDSEMSAEAVDVLNDNGAVTIFREPRVANADPHGTGCRLSAAIAAGLANEMTLETAVGRAKQFVLEEIRETAKRTW